MSAQTSRRDLVRVLLGLLVVIVLTLAIGLLFTAAVENSLGADVDGSAAAVPDDYHLDPVEQDRIVDELDRSTSLAELDVDAGSGEVV